jgi:hypothetical protein
MTDRIHLFDPATEGAIVRTQAAGASSVVG